MLVPIFSLKLNHSVLPRTVSVGKFDAIHPSLVCGINGGKVLIHSPHAQKKQIWSEASDISLLNINLDVVSIATGVLDVNCGRDMLFVGTATNLMAYDVYKNADVFFKDVPDGANALVVGKLGSIETQLAITGGNSSIQGYTCTGEEAYWTVTGDNISSMELVDFDGNGLNNLVVGSEDFDIRVFRHDEIIAEINETDVVATLCRMQGSKFGYALANGTVGVYDRSTRYWRIKSKNQAIAVHGYDVDLDGVDELITGWSNGKIDARSDRTGEVIFKDNLSHPCAGFVKANYNMDPAVSTEQLICVSVDGEVRGYNCSNNTAEPGRSVDWNSDQDLVRELNQRKQNLLLELKNYEENFKAAASLSTAVPVKSTEGVDGHEDQQVISYKGLPPRNDDQPAVAGNRGNEVVVEYTSGNGVANRGRGDLSGYRVGAGLKEYEREAMGVIPANTQLQTTISVNKGNNSIPPHVELFISTTNDTIIRAVLIFSEGIFDGESHVIHPRNKDLSGTLRVPIILPKDIPVDLHIKAFVGNKNRSGTLQPENPFGDLLSRSYLHSNTQFHVFELTRQLPRFSMYLLSPESISSLPRSSVSVQLNDRPQRFLMWINQSFLLSEDLTGDGELNIAFRTLRNSDWLSFVVKKSGPLTIYTDDMELAGDIIQSLAQFFNIEHLLTSADFPLVINSLKETLKKVDSFHAARQKITAEMADHTILLRGMVVRAEDARILGDMRQMRKRYMDLYHMNRDLINDYNIRCGNHKELLSCLKLVNQTIQRASRLRVGRFKTQVVNCCRLAVKNNNTSSLVKIITTGQP